MGKFVGWDLYCFNRSDLNLCMGIFFLGISAYFSRYCELKFLKLILNRDVDRASRDGLDLQHIARSRRLRPPLRSSGPSACFSRQEPRDAIASPVWANYAARVARNATALPHVQTTQRASRATRQRCPTCKLRSARRAQRASVAPRANYAARVTRNAPALPHVQTTLRALRATRQ